MQNYLVLYLLSSEVLTVIELKENCKQLRHLLHVGKHCLNIAFDTMSFFTCLWFENTICVCWITCLSRI